MSSKLREALEELIANIEIRSSTFGFNVMVDTKTFLDAKAALAEPLRNCDVGTAEEQYNRFVYCCSSRKIPCRKSYTHGCVECYSKWAQMPYESEVKGWQSLRN